MFAIVVTWEAPEQGVAVYGPYWEFDQADKAIPHVARDFENEGQLPIDVLLEVQPLIETE